MSVAVFISEPSDVKSVVPWGARFAFAAETDLLVVVPRKSKGKKVWQNVTAEDDLGESSLLKEVFLTVDQIDFTNFHEPTNSDSDGAPLTTIKVQELISPDAENDFVAGIAEFDIRLLLIPAHEPEKSKANEDYWINKLLLECPCEIMIIRGCSLPWETKPKVLVVSDGDVDTDIALSRAKGVTTTLGGSLSLLYVRPDDDALALQVARYQLNRLSKNTRIDLEPIPKKTLLHDSLREAIKAECEKQQPNLVLLGTRNLKKIKDVLRPADTGGFNFSIATIRDGIPFSSRLLNEFRLWTRSRVPQMNREQRVKLVDRLNINSNFDFDFVALIVLSTMIAALGLVQNSGAVVIGAMLVAPLMTPLVGIGFSLVQGNERLVRTSLKSVILGFVVAFAVGVLIGLSINAAHAIGILTAGVNPNGSELQGRGHPAILDWFIAFVSGIAAAYAMSRPNLLSALPGVAIAAALVPPIATSGLAIAVFDFSLSLGSFVLFFTNIVAIVLGTAITFWTVGVDSRSATKSKDGKNHITWPRYWFLAFVILSVVVATGMSAMQRMENRSTPEKRLEPPSKSGSQNN